MHRAVFAEENEPPGDFWEQLFIAMESDKRGDPIPNTPPGLKKRFGWVYKYVLTGHIPVEVLRFMDALRQIWNEDGTILRITTHPYTLKAECATSSFMNPDLCPRWVGWMMTKSNAMAKVLQTLPDRYGVEISEMQIKWSYGILIPVLWEEAYKLGLLKNADGSVAEGSSTYRHYFTPKFDDTTGFHEAGLTKIEDEKPRSTQPEDERPADLELHKNSPRESDCESVEIESDQVGETELESLQTAEATKDLISRSYFNGNLVGKEASSDCDLGRKAYQALQNVEDDEGLFIYFDANGINFPFRNGTLLHSLHVSALRGSLLEHYNHERRLQLQPVQNTSLSALSEDAKPGDLKKGNLPSAKPLKSRQVTAGGNNMWSTEEAEWFYGRLFIEQSSDFHGLAKALNELFGIDRTALSLRGFATQCLHWTPRKDPSYAWHPSSTQAYWIVKRANKGQSWKDMARDFNEEFKSTRTSEELQLGYEEILKALDPESPEAKKLGWANGNNIFHTNTMAKWAKQDLPAMKKIAAHQLVEDMDEEERPGAYHLDAADDECSHDA
ncbi:MAG: hypothetical protein Q9208_006893 [Pyrenodesmia sp. 3 TL-2023]